MKESIILIGGGGHCVSCIDIIERENRFSIAGIVDIPERKGQNILDYPVIGSDQDLHKLIRSCSNFLITLGQSTLSNRRVELFNDLKKMGACFPVIKSPLAYVSRRAFVAEGTIIMHNAFINSGVNIGKNCIINTRALVEHDCILGDFVNISPGANVSGNVHVEEGAFIGANATILQGKSEDAKLIVGEHATIGAGAVVVRSVAPFDVVVGVPARSIRKDS